MATVGNTSILTRFFCASVDAYRSTRMKELERPGVKQVIVRKENVGARAEEPTGTSVFSIRQKMKVWAPAGCLLAGSRRSDPGLSAGFEQ